MKKQDEAGPIQKWAKKINWEKRAKAVCKPCWEIKYCPYGPLVEDFPLQEMPDKKACRIYGHDCPVFYAAEPFTETKELRNISRSIPRATMFRVLKRENQICSGCGKPVKDEEIEFDHIIPYSKGGSSDESNVTLLCRDCNRKKGKKFEEAYLVGSFREHVVEPVEIDFVCMIIDMVKFSHHRFKTEGRFPVPSDFCEWFGDEEIQEDHKFFADLMDSLRVLFRSKKPKNIRKNTFEALKYRWGFTDGAIHKLEHTRKKFKMGVEEMLEAERDLVSRLGWQVQSTEQVKKKWLKL